MWMFGNVVAKLDRKDNICPNKELPDAKIDGVVALIMALNRCLARQDGNGMGDYVEWLARA
jgi:phage terminase large subunit-like protein